MDNDLLIKGLRQLGFDSGWILQNGNIVLWENSETQPSFEQIKEAAELYDKEQIDKEKARAQVKSAAEAKLAALGLDADDLKALGLA